MPTPQAQFGPFRLNNNQPANNQFTNPNPVSDPNNLPDFNFNLSGRPSGKHQKRAFATTLGAAQATQRTLPGLLNTYYQGLNMNAPILAQGQLDIMQRYGIPFAQAQSDIDRVGQMGAAQRDYDVLSTVGRQLTGEQAAQDRTVNPEFYEGREAYSKKNLEMLAGMDPNRLTEAETANVERNQNRSNIGRGLANSGSNIGAISNAMMFDDRLQNKRANLNNILTSFGGTLPGLTRNFNSALSMGKGGTDLSALAGVLPTANMGLTQGIHQTGAGLFGPAYGQAKQSYDSRVKPLERTLGAVNSATSTLGNIAGAAAGISDRRLKTDIKKLKDGDIGIYEFSYTDDPLKTRYIGAMADEVKKIIPSAVGTAPNGFMFVDYNHPELRQRGIRFVELGS